VTHAAGQLTELNIRPLHLPPKNSYSLRLLMESNYTAWERVQRLLDSLQQELFGDESGQSFYDDIIKLIDSGLIAPDVKIDGTTQDATIRFQMWSYIDKRYKYIEDMEDEEFDILNGMLEYFARTN
jgi:hypothetical protein